ncbi:hypothetical protein CHARACLAT_026165 [Characodon lateralis]|uniref:HORMA domain-containing protein n=1 Tax=Characodon lateralis TaxID=208331 RepID=A0ABU7DKB5_9TELE|nr:hypothetical protein [Characodon lateralis]
MSHISVYSFTPADYQPPGFQEGVYDRLWFQGMPVHFKVGQVQTIYHSLRLRVSVEQGQVKKLQEENYVKEHRQVSPGREAVQSPPKRKDAEEDLPSEDESAQFKKPKKPLAKKKAAPKSVARKKRRI